MGEKKFPFPAPDSLLYSLLTLVALCGEFPVRLLSRLPGSESYKAKAVTNLKSQGRLYTYYHDSLRGLRLTAAAKQELLTVQPERFANVLSGKSVISAPKYAPRDRLRLHRMAEVLVTMLNADVVAFPWEKPDIFSSGRQPAITHPMYYSSVEVKDMGNEGNKIRNSRATGLLFSPDSIYAVYNTANGEMKWEKEAEMRFKVTSEKDICMKRLPDQYGSVKTDAIIFGAGMEQMQTLFTPVKTGRKPIAKSDVYEHMYFLTSDHRGEVILQLLCDATKKNALDRLLMEDFLPGGDYFTENDGFEKDGTPVLFGYTCDMPRIYRFNEGLISRNLHGTIACFDFQKEALRHVCCQGVMFQIIEFDNYERKMFHLTRKTD